MKVFLYARKSTDDEERQILSIDAQRNELREYAAKQGLEIVFEFVESMTAKEPGRPIFNNMLRRVENGEADALLAWHPDRLARNSIDGGRIIWLVDTGKITALKFPTFWFENTPQGKFVLNMAFGQSKYYVDALSENVRRGIREKIRRGVYPHKPPIGYVNDPRLKTIEVHQQKASLIRRIFETYATGRYNYDQMVELATQWGLLSHQERPIARSVIPQILSDRFYIGFFAWAGDEYEGTHERIIPVELFERVQRVLMERGRGRYRTKKGLQPVAFLGFVRCRVCGSWVTVERHKTYHYYRCAKKLGSCDLVGYLREEYLAQQMRRELLRVGISDEWAELMLGRIEEWRRDGADRATAEASAHQKRLAEVEAKVARLLDVFLDGSITREEYAARKAEYFTEKTRQREKIDRIRTQGNCWIEPLADFVKAANLAQNTAISGSYAELRVFFQRFQLNLFLERPEAGETENENRMLPPSERSGQKADPAARRGGLAARADLPTPQEPPRIASADPIRNSLYPSLKVRASLARRAAPENTAAPDLAAGKKWSSQRVSNRGNLPPRLCVEFVGPWKNWAEKMPNLKWSRLLTDIRTWFESHYQRS